LATYSDGRMTMTLSLPKAGKKDMHSLSSAEFVMAVCRHYKINKHVVNIYSRRLLRGIIQAIKLYPI
jgi:hypothetical protein